jgi:hypothetical protein
MTRPTKTCINVQAGDSGRWKASSRTVDRAGKLGGNSIASSAWLPHRGQAVEVGALMNTTS